MQVSSQGWRGPKLSIGVSLLRHLRAALLLVEGKVTALRCCPLNSYTIQRWFRSVRRSIFLETILAFEHSDNRIRKNADHSTRNEHLPTNIH